MSCGLLWLSGAWRVSNIIMSDPKMVYPRSMLVGSPYHESKNQSWRHFVSSNDFENQNMTIEVDLHNIHQGLRLLDVLWVDLAFGRIRGFKHHHVGSENVVTKIYVSRVSKSWILKPILETFRLIQSFGKHVFSKHILHACHNFTLDICHLHEKLVTKPLWL